MTGSCPNVIHGKCQYESIKGDATMYVVSTVILRGRPLDAFSLDDMLASHRGNLK